MLADFPANKDPDSTRLNTDAQKYGHDRSSLNEAAVKAFGPADTDLESLNVVKGFSAAAQQYKQYDSVQRLSAERLFTQMQLQGQTIPPQAEQGAKPLSLLDVGCGPGTDFSTLVLDATIGSVTALDVSPAMLQCVRQDFPQYQTVCADAQLLPFVKNRFDTIYSNLAIQWCRDLPAVFNESSRVLKQGGRFHCAIVTDGSLPELKSLGLRHNQFYSKNQVRQSLLLQHWSDVRVEQHTLQVHFADLKTLLYSIKGVGASTEFGVSSHYSNIEPSISSKDTAAQTEIVSGVKLRGRKDWIALQQRAESIRQPKGIPLSYNITFIEAVAH